MYTVENYKTGKIFKKFEHNCDGYSEAKKYLEKISSINNDELYCLCEESYLYGYAIILSVNGILWYRNNS